MRKSRILTFRICLSLVFAVQVSRTANAFLFVGRTDAGTIGTYTNSGVAINPSLITGAGFIDDIALADNKLYVLVSTTSGTSVAVYNTTGQVINSSLITGPRATAIAVSGGSIFIGTNENHGTVRQYTTSGNLVNPALITGLQPTFEFPNFGDMVISGGNLFVASWGSNNGLTYQSTVGEYALSGAPMNPDLITFSQGIATALAVTDSNIYVRNSVTAEQLELDTIAQYTTSGQLIDPTFITGVTDPNAVVVSGQDIFVANGSIGGGSIGKYTISGDPVDPDLISNLGFATIAASGSGAGVPERFSTLWLALPVLGIFFAAAGARKFTTA